MTPSRTEQARQKYDLKIWKPALARGARRCFRPRQEQADTRPPGLLFRSCRVARALREDSARLECGGAVDIVELTHHVCAVREHGLPKPCGPSSPLLTITFAKARQSLQQLDAPPLVLPLLRDAWIQASAGWLRLRLLESALCKHPRSASTGRVRALVTSRPGDARRNRSPL